MRIGLDIGSTTMKCVVLDSDGTVVYLSLIHICPSLYRR